MPDDIDLIAVPRLCAACDHKHGGKMTEISVVPPCACGCDTFRLHPAESVAIDAADVDDAAAFPNGRILEGDYAAGLHHVCVSLEAGINGDGWDQLPRCGVFYLSAPADGPAGTKMLGVVVAPLNLGYANLIGLTNGDIDLVLVMLAEMAGKAPAAFDAYRRASGIDPGAPVVGWWATYEAYTKARPGGSANTDPSLRTDEVRQLVAVDVDERVHEITRLRSSGEVVGAVDPLRRYEQALADEGSDGGHSGMRLAGGGMPPVVANLLRLTRITRSETQIRHAFVQDAD